MSRSSRGRSSNRGTGFDIFKGGIGVEAGGLDDCEVYSEEVEEMECGEYPK
jgi:hypothetical protein